MTRDVPSLVLLRSIKSQFGCDMDALYRLDSTYASPVKFLPRRVVVVPSLTTAPRGGRTGQRTGRGGGGTGEPTGRVGGRTGDQGGQGGDQGNHASNIQGDVRSANVGIVINGCSYKDFMVCNPKDYDEKDGVIAYTRSIDKMESVQDMSGCGANQNVKYNAGSFISKALTWWNTQVQSRGRESAVGMTWEEFKDLMRNEFCPNNEMQKLETEF
ncbi:hypothetical protein Tco_0045032 [Tanacetum coccineum]